jgi:hypothetical protein
MCRTDGISFLPLPTATIDRNAKSVKKITGAIRSDFVISVRSFSQFSALQADKVEEIKGFEAQLR